MGDGMERKENRQLDEHRQKQMLLIDQLQEKTTLTADELKELLVERDQIVIEYLCKKASTICGRHYGRKIYARALIEFTNYCRNDCLYCGIRSSNKKIERYRLSDQEIFDCVNEGYQLGFRTFVLQGGEDAYYTKRKIGMIVKKIKESCPDCAVTLSFGEWDRAVYEYWYECGADRYLLRHETADKMHYQTLHPCKMSFDHRRRCLSILKEIGYQTGAGCMIGSPGQTPGLLVKDLLYMKEFQPHMAGIGPFIPQKDTPFASKPSGTVAMTLKMLAIVRLLLPKILLPSTTALATVHPMGREYGIFAGANVLMPNLTPQRVRGKYILYDNKISTGAESAQKIAFLKEKLNAVGYELCMERGDSLMQEKIQ